MGFINLLLNLYTVKKMDKGEDAEGSFKKILVIGGIISAVVAIVPIIFAICLLSYGKNRMNEMDKEFMMKTGTFEERQALLEPEELKGKYTDLFEDTNLIDSVDDAVAAVMADYGMIYVAGGSNDVYVVSDGYFMYYLDIAGREPFVAEVTNKDGSVKSLNDFMAEISNK